MRGPSPQPSPGVPGEETSHVIIGVGLVTPLGLGVATTWAGILAGHFVTDVGRVPIERDGSARVSQLAIHAAREAVGDRDVADVPLFVGTSKGPVDEWLNADRVPIEPIGLHTLASDLARSLHMAGPRETYSAACASGLHALARACLCLDTGAATRVLVVASESSLHTMWLGAFRTLGVLAKPGEPCRPFDASHAGFVVSEAAAAMLIERRMAGPGEVVVERCRIAADATHLTGMDASGRTMRELIREVAGGRLAEVDLVHAHATGTRADAVEQRAIAEAFAARPDGVPAVYASKSAIGHTLGASGLVAAVLNTQMHRACCGARPPSRCTLVLASGFGGAAATALLRTT